VLPAVARTVVAVSAYEYPPLRRLDLLAEDKLLLTGVFDSILPSSFGTVSLATGFGEAGDSNSGTARVPVTVKFNETKFVSSSSSSIF